ncbi:NADPH-dependent FMN reductase [Corynebacterium propinquum]|uniref:NADPH-dependent FMN reductase n=1 Tax=Corynebacterium propinquum TaxID=43769 RepID=A0ABT7G4D5_9CORY|nr:NADPH-dependent FMN reductase [Corynebacterium propinquum]MCG7231297.1 NAD(P)H-dependent oxidoreductase [Corynebacterium propinquum]MCT1817976.1 NAD(P)H-dependent oxidoreductase [Corynebacterium propinquum]MDK4235506.1 NADPH-dependent FMN reductase [Corynebacterium propinquum]MDK4301614.1 NADPH-dependent FMN reductase [Corynebacterium propinquum]MDK4313336.1 NADPH-dependent FMN reductase [Corynebacterium propinquum]
MLRMNNPATDNTQAAPTQTAPAQETPAQAATTQAAPTQKTSASKKKQITVLVGSLRGGSFARKIATQAIELLPEDCTGTIVEIGHLPLYNFDYDDPEVPDVQTPHSYTEFRETIKDSDGILFVTSENNRTIPACLKNAIDIGSKPNSDVSWKHLPAGIISHSVGRMGGYSSQKNLRLALSYFEMPTPGQPEVFLGQSPSLLDDAGAFNNDKTRDFVADYLRRFAELMR